MERIVLLEELFDELVSHMAATETAVRDGFCAFESASLEKYKLLLELIKNCYRPEKESLEVGRGVWQDDAAASSRTRQGEGASHVELKRSKVVGEFEDHFYGGTDEIKSETNQKLSLSGQREPNAREMGRRNYPPWEKLLPKVIKWIKTERQERVRLSDEVNRIRDVLLQDLCGSSGRSASMPAKQMDRVRPVAIQPRTEKSSETNTNHARQSLARSIARYERCLSRLRQER